LFFIGYVLYYNIYIYNIVGGAMPLTLEDKLINLIDDLEKAGYHSITWKKLAHGIEVIARNAKVVYGTTKCTFYISSSTKNKKVE
jgi:hypothetical protein